MAPCDPHVDKSHYDGDLEPIDLIESQRLGFHEGNIIKYVSRWRRKGGLSDLYKAKVYLTRLIEIETKAEEDAAQGDIFERYR